MSFNPPFVTTQRDNGQQIASLDAIKDTLCLRPVAGEDVQTAYTYVRSAGYAKQLTRISIGVDCPITFVRAHLVIEEVGENKEWFRDTGNGIWIVHDSPPSCIMTRGSEIKADVVASKKENSLILTMRSLNGLAATGTWIMAWEKMIELDIFF